MWCSDNCPITGSENSSSKALGTSVKDCLASEKLCDMVSRLIGVGRATLNRETPLSEFGPYKEKRSPWAEAFVVSAPCQQMQCSKLLHTCAIMTSLQIMNWLSLAHCEPKYPLPHTACFSFNIFIKATRKEN